MKKIISRALVIIFILPLISFKSYSQTDLSTFQLSDVDPYFNAYFKPLATATAVGMGGGWYNTAATHKLLGIDVSLLTFSIPMIPDEDKVVQASDIELPNGYSLSTQGDVPTIAASKDLEAPILRKTVTLDNPVPGNTGLEYTQDIYQLFKGGGVGVGFVPNMFQLGIGLPKGTDLKVRFFPTIPMRSFEYSMWGVGVQHDIKQWIPGVKKVPVLQISGVLAYSKFTADYSGTPFPVDPTLFTATTNLPDNTWENQTLGLDVTSFVGNLVVGAKLPVFHPYVSAGFNKYSFTGGLKGSYPVVTIRQEGANLPYKIVEDTDEDPLNIETDSGDKAMMNVAAGFRLKLAVITIWGQYTAQKYPMVTAGLGISIR